jgi:inner membrane transporter RhtA
VSLRRRTDAVPPQVLLLIGMASVQFGAAFAHTLFDKASPTGVVLLRLAFAALLLLTLARPRLAGRSRTDLLAAAGFGLVLACMNWSFYSSLDRLPLGVAVTVEFLGPLGVAVAGSAKLLDLVWVLLAAGGVTLLALGGSRGELNPTTPPACCWPRWRASCGRPTSCCPSGWGHGSPAWTAWRSRWRWEPW